MRSRPARPPARRHRRIAGITVAILASIAALASAPAHAAPTPPLSHEGRWITDSKGRVVILHGFNMVNKARPYYPAAAGFGADDARFLASEGFNTVRVGVIYAGVEPRPGRHDDAYLRRIAKTVAELRRQGIFSLLDFHQDLYNERFQGEGFPDWAVQDDGFPNPSLGFPGNYAANPALERAFDNFWANRPGPGGVGLQSRYAAAWRHVASRFRDERMLVGYDIINEPWPGSAWPTCANPEGCPPGGFDDELTRFSRRVVGAIRAADRRTLVWYEPHPLFAFGADTRHGDTGDRRAGFTFHNYCLAAQPGLPALPGSDELCPVGEEGFVYSHAEDQSRRTGDALLMSEFGATDDVEYVERIADQADGRMLSWQNWTYADVLPGAPGVVNDHGSLIKDAFRPATQANMKQGKLDALARPYPRVVAGTPRRFSFDRGSRSFELDYSTARAGGGRGFAGSRLATEVFLPHRHYPGPFRTDVRGASVTSRPCARVLRLRNSPGAGQVTVRVRPAPRCIVSDDGGVRGLGRGRLRIRIRRVPKRCTERNFTARVRIRRASGRKLRRVKVYVDGRRVRRTKKRRFRLRIRARRLRPGRHRIKVRAVDRDGRRAGKRKRFRRCRGG